MQIASIATQDHADFLALVNAEIRPDRAKTNAWDDFPLILSLENRAWQLAAYSETGEIAACLACLIRDYRTSCGVLSVAGIGSVVTRQEYRGRGLSSALQNEMLTRLRRKNVPLAVLWTDEPAIYAGRGFVAAGWEMHMDLAGARFPTARTGLAIRPYAHRDCEAVETLYSGHALHTVRLAGDSTQLYGMPGTRGLVAEVAGDVTAAAFCGKGGDFPGYVAEWAGAAGDILSVLGAVVERGWADKVLIPAGSEALVDTLVDLGAGWFAQPSGYWVVLDPQPLIAAAAQHGRTPPSALSDPTAWLGTVDADGRPVPGLVDVAVWGLDSV